ncbi:MAG: hypothetical protein Q9202_004725 [Teloschistes flavicans]
MSVSTFSLPAVPNCVAAKQNLKTAWDSLALLCEQVQKGVAAPKRNAGPILLAAKYLKLELDKEEPHGDEHDLVVATWAVMQAAKQLGPELSVHLFKRSSIDASIVVARKELNELQPPGAIFNKPKHHDRIDVEHCRLVWGLIRLARTSFAEKEISKYEVKKAIDSLDLMLENIPAEEEVEDESQGSEEPSASTIPGQRRNLASNAAMMNVLEIREEERPILARYNPTGLVPVTGLTQSPWQIFHSDVQCFIGNHWLNDSVINAYLALVCHHGNGHFDNANAEDNWQRFGTPKYHAWTTSGLDEGWPPKAYPEAKLENVEHQFFPVLVRRYHDLKAENNHWIMYHLHKCGDSSWKLNFYSGIRSDDYAISGFETWLQPCAWRLTEMSAGHIKFGEDVPYEEPDNQPRQSNSDDCGVLLLGVARWIMEGWDLGELRSDDCRTLRDRMLVEVDQWRLR